LFILNVNLKNLLYIFSNYYFTFKFKYRNPNIETILKFSKFKFLKRNPV